MSCRSPLLARLALVVLGAELTLACHQKSDGASAPAARPSASAKPLDRLAPGELSQGPNEVFGFAVPSGMKVRGAFLEIAYLQGNVTPEAVANYVRDRVDVEHVEIGAGSTVFPRVHIKHGAPDRIYDFQVSAAAGDVTDLVIRDVTPRPKDPPGMTDEQRWRQAGYAPDGKPLDPNQLK